MSNEEQNTDHVVWGHPVPRHPSGRLKWTDAIKAQAVDRVLAGEKVVDLANEVGANKSLVAKWVDVHMRGNGAKTNTAAFVEVIALDEAKPTILPGSGPASCELHREDARLTIPLGFPADDLSEILRVMRATQ